jgi:carbonic anhydrase
MIQNFKKDFGASIVVFLVALPLCLGVALASGAPAFSGIVSGIVGGIIVGLLSQSQTSVSGPAAGLAAVVFSTISSLGSFELFLTALIISGCFQVLLSWLKAGFIADFVPSNVIKGLLAAIGIILILKQLPHAVGFDKDPEGDFGFFQSDGANTFSELFNIFRFFKPGAIIISGLSLLILIFWPKTIFSKIKFLPASLLVVLLGVGLNYVFQQWMPSLAIESTHLVSLPYFEMGNIQSYFHGPSVAHWQNPHVWMAGLTIAIIASLETLLNIEAVDKIDPLKRISPPNRELFAQGVGNICSGLLGGIPITSVIVRSSVNISTHNQTKMSTILHGLFLLLSILLLSPILSLIPLASLAAILLYTGYKLANIGLFKEMYRKGWVQFTPFIVTILAIIFTDLLIGILVGLAVGIVFLMRSNYQNPFVREDSKLHIGDVVKLVLPNQVSFLNKATIKETLWSVPEQSKLVIDASFSDYIDADILELIEDFKTVVAPQKNIQLNILGLKDATLFVQDHIQFVNILDKATQQKLQAKEVLELLQLGNERFIQGKWTDKYYLHQVNATAVGQNPMAVIVGCIDSRTSPEILFDAGIGDILTVRIAGNIISPEIIGSLEIAVEKLGAKLIVVKGHSSCGAVASSFKQDDKVNTLSVTAKINRAIVQCGCSGKSLSDVDDHTIMQITKQNVHNSITDILENSPYLKQKIEQNEIGIVSAYHDLQTGKVHFNA